MFFKAGIRELPLSHWSAILYKFCLLYIVCPDMYTYIHSHSHEMLSRVEEMGWNN